MGKVFLQYLLLVILSAFPGLNIFPQTRPSMFITEIMFYAETGNNEFIEIYNPDETESIDVRGYGINYNTSKRDVITDAGYGTILPPKSFAVILEGDYDFPDGIYNKLIPQSALILKISDNSFGTSGMANSAGRAIILYNGSGGLIDSCFYTANNSENISDEKIFLDSAGTASNWSNGICPYGTPGFRNSVTPYNFDLTVDYLHIIPSRILLDTRAQIEIKLRNRGLLNSGQFALRIYDDVNKDSVTTLDELIFEDKFTGLEASDSVIYSFDFLPHTIGRHIIFATVASGSDENLSNNILASTLDVYLPEHQYNDVVVNEIMYAPKNGEPEWMELYNRTGGKINLKGWSVSDNSSTVSLSKNDFFMNSGSYLVICKDSSLPMPEQIKNILICKNMPALNNSGDNIILKDSLSTTIDSLFYKPSWGGTNGKSLERKEVDLKSTDSSAWGTCMSVNNCTPGSINSISRKEYDIAVTKVLFYPEKPLIGSDAVISALIKNYGKNPIDYTLEIFEDTNLDSLFENHISLHEIFSLQPGDSALPALNYIIKNIDCKKFIMVKANSPGDQDTSNNYSSAVIKPGYSPSTMLINEVMLNPSAGEPEWIELYNASNKDVDLNGWTVSDVLTKPYSVKLKDKIILQPGAFLVLTADTSIYDYHKNINCLTTVLNIPLLNNDEDGVVLKDDRDVIIDSMFYSSKDYKLTKGYSLERKSLKVSSSIKNNWGISKDYEQSTPGRLNSIAVKNHDLFLGNITSEPDYPVKGEDVFISAKIFNIGESTVPDFKILFYYKSGSNGSVYSLLCKDDGINLNPGDSVIIKSSEPVRNIRDDIFIKCSIIYSGDEDTLNNFLQAAIKTGYPEGIVKINEIMYSPFSGESEWFEIFNTSQTDSVNLKKWMVTEILPVQKKNLISDSSFYIAPNEYLVIAKDESILKAFPQCSLKVKIINIGTLGNSEDGIVLFDAGGKAIDSVFYRNDWGGNSGRSLEKISSLKESNDSTNWKTSVAETNGTPGYKNSVVNLISYKRNSMVINEIMYDPSAENSEYIELINTSGQPVNLAGWFAGDQNGSGSCIYGSNLIVQPGSYFVIASDSSLLLNYEFNPDAQINITGSQNLSLSNSGEIIILKDALGNTVDSVFYNPDWRNNNFSTTKNVSLEKINPFLDGNNGSNWSGSVDKSGGTPGKRNSIYAVNINAKTKLSVSPNPFSPDNDGFEDFALINYRLNNKTAQVRIRIFSSRGYLVRTLEDCMQSGNEGSIVFDGYDDNKNPLRIGIYIILLEAFNQNSAILESMKTVVVIARKLH